MPLIFPSFRIATELKYFFPSASFLRGSIKPTSAVVPFVILASPFSHLIFSSTITGCRSIVSSIGYPISASSGNTIISRPILHAYFIYFAIFFALYSILPAIGLICAIPI